MEHPLQGALKSGIAKSPFGGGDGSENNAARPFGNGSKKNASRPFGNGSKKNAARLFCDGSKNNLLFKH